MISKYTYKNLIWIDIERPQAEEVRLIEEEYNVPNLISEQLLNESIRSKVDIYDNFIYTVMHFPNLTTEESPEKIEQEVDFVVGNNVIITVHYEPVKALSEFAKQFSVNSKLDRTTMATHAGYLYYFIIREFYKNIFFSLEDLNAWLVQIEKNIFDGHEEKMVKVISNVNRHLLDYKQSLRFHKETLLSFEQAGKKFFGVEFSYYLTAMISEYNKVERMLTGHKEILNDLRDTNDSLLTTKTNKIMKKLTVMNFIILPLALITGIFGMNTDITIIKGIEQFYVVLSIMFLLGLCMFFYFRQQKWF